MILALQAADKMTRLWLLQTAQSSTERPSLEWESGRELSDQLLRVLVDELHKVDRSLTDLSGVVVFSGPGSFTSLRIGHATANALADSLGIPVVGAQGDDWITVGLKAFSTAQPGQPALPHYGSEAHITRPVPSAPRSDNTRLPGKSELSRILQVEAHRLVAPGKEHTHYADFSAVIRLFEHFHLPTDLFAEHNLSIHDIVVAGEDLLNRAMLVFDISEHSAVEIELWNAAYDYLTEEDTPSQADLIFVFGAKTPLRAEKAAELFHAGLAPRIMVSGGSPVYAKATQESEAERYRAILVGRGVPESAIIVEHTSITVADNVRCSLNVLDNQGFGYGSILLVNSPYSQRRGWALFKKHVPDTIALQRVNCGTAERYQREYWYRQEPTLRVVLNEYIKLRASVAYNTA